MAYTLRFILAFLILSAIPSFSYAEKQNLNSRCKVRYPSDDLVEWDCVMIKKGQTIESLFNDSWIDVARFNRIDRRHSYPGRYIKVPKNLQDIKNYTPMPDHYPDAQDEAKFILIDLSEEFLGAYEYGKLVFSTPVATGEKGKETPDGEFRVTAFDRNHVSSKYTIEKTDILYPMHYGLRFYISKDWVSFWIHGRDIPGKPASHGCIGLYDEEMQKEYYGYPKDPVLQDARTLFEWVLGDTPDNGGFTPLKDGPRVRIIGDTP